jgi:hypothetical protein
VHFFDHDIVPVTVCKKKREGKKRRKKKEGEKKKKKTKFNIGTIKIFLIF